MQADTSAAVGHRETSVSFDFGSLPSLSLDKISRQESDPFLSLLSARTPVNVSTVASTEIHQAVLAGNASEVTRILVKKRSRDGPTATEAFVNLKNELGYTALMNAAALADEHLSVAMIDILLSHGADIAATDLEGYTCLHWAASCGSAPRIRDLLAHGANLHATALDGEAPLHRAARFGRAEVITELVARGARSRAQNKELMSAWDVAGRFSDAFNPEYRTQAVRALIAADPTLRVLFLHHADCMLHEGRVGHQEAPERIAVILKRVRECKEREVLGEEVHVSDAVPLATDAQILRAHSEKFLHLIEALDHHVCKHSIAIPFTPHLQRGLRGQPLEAVKAAEHSDTPFSIGSLPAARRAAGAVCAAVDAVMSGSARNAFCCVRPPGHHAGVNGLLEDFPSSQSCGFCIFNSVAIGALHAMEAQPNPARRVAIIDFDIHHGNGTEEIVRRWATEHRSDRSQAIFFFSVHLYDVEREKKDAAPLVPIDGSAPGGGVGGGEGGEGEDGGVRTRRRTRGSTTRPSRCEGEEEGEEAVPGSASASRSTGGGGGGGEGGEVGSERRMPVEASMLDVSVSSEQPRASGNGGGSSKRKRSSGGATRHRTTHAGNVSVDAIPASQVPVRLSVATGRGEGGTNNPLTDDTSQLEGEVGEKGEGEDVTPPSARKGARLSNGTGVMRPFPIYNWTGSMVLPPGVEGVVRAALVSHVTRRIQLSYRSDELSDLKASTGRKRRRPAKYDDDIVDLPASAPAAPTSAAKEGGVASVEHGRRSASSSNGAGTGAGSVSKTWLSHPSRSSALDTDTDMSASSGGGRGTIASGEKSAHAFSADRESPPAHPPAHKRNRVSEEGGEQGDTEDNLATTTTPASVAPHANNGSALMTLSDSAPTASATSGGGSGTKLRMRRGLLNMAAEAHRPPPVDVAHTGTVAVSTHSNEPLAGEGDGATAPTHRHSTTESAQDTGASAGVGETTAEPASPAARAHASSSGTDDSILAPFHIGSTPAPTASTPILRKTLSERMIVERPPRSVSFSPPSSSSGTGIGSEGGAGLDATSPARASRNRSFTWGQATADADPALYVTEAGVSLTPRKREGPVHAPSVPSQTLGSVGVPPLRRATSAPVLPLGSPSGLLPIGSVNLAHYVASPRPQVEYRGTGFSPSLSSSGVAAASTDLLRATGEDSRSTGMFARRSSFDVVPSAGIFVRASPPAAASSHAGGSDELGGEGESPSSSSSSSSPTSESESEVGWPQAAASAPPASSPGWRPEPMTVSYPTSGGEGGASGNALTQPAGSSAFSPGAGHSAHASSTTAFARREPNPTVTASVLVSGEGALSTAAALSQTARISVNSVPGAHGGAPVEVTQFSPMHPAVPLQRSGSGKGEAWHFGLASPAHGGLPPLHLGLPAASPRMLSGIGLSGMVPPADAAGGTGGHPTVSLTLTATMGGPSYAAMSGPGKGGAGNPSPREDDDVVYSFYPGTGQSDSMQHNVWNAPIQPLWRERRETRTRNRDARKAVMGRLAARRLIVDKLIPSLRAFGPDLILISAGFDGGHGDVGNSKNDGKATPGMNLLPEDFAWITSQILAVARVCCPGKVVSVLEGGYGQWKWKKVPKAEAEAEAGMTTPTCGEAAAAATGSPQNGHAATGGTTTTSTTAGGAGGGGGDGGMVAVPYLFRENLADNCLAHLQALVDDGAAMDALVVSEGPAE